MSMESHLGPVSMEKVLFGPSGRTYEVYTERSPKWRFRLRGTHGPALCCSLPYDPGPPNTFLCRRSYYRHESAKLGGLVTDRGKSGQHAPEFADWSLCVSGGSTRIQQLAG